MQILRSKAKSIINKQLCNFDTQLKAAVIKSKLAYVR